jgi:hypothetical protein
LKLLVLAAVAAQAQSPIVTAPPVPVAPPPAAATPAPSASAPAPTAAPASQSAPESGPCADGPYRQFDFWVGDWTAYESGGADVLAHVKVTRLADGCGLLEETTPVKGPSSAALILYDHDATLWRRESIDGDGGMLSLQGGMQEGEMDLEGEQATGAGHGLARITWRNQGGVVTESAQKSTDGKDWTTWFDWDLRRSR